MLKNHLMTGLRVRGMAGSKKCGRVSNPVDVRQNKTNKARMVKTWVRALDPGCFEFSLINKYQYSCSGRGSVERAHLAKQLMEAIPSLLIGRYDTHQIWSTDAHQILNSVPALTDTSLLSHGVEIRRIGFSTWRISDGPNPRTQSPQLSMPVMGTLKPRGPMATG